MTPELAHRPEDGKRAPLEIGAWAVYETGAPGLHEYTAGMLAPPGMRLVRIVDGPRYVKDDREHAVEELWRCDDGQDRSRWCLTRVFVDETAADARARAACVLRWQPFDARDTNALALRAARIAELARMRPQPDTGDLLEIIRAARELGDALTELHRFVHVSLPNAARSLYWAGMLALAAEDPGVLYAGVPHRDADAICDLIARRRQ